ncbi:uncharacterized protein LOC131842817 [Achroia grisella]|uniref:uncharacterized protein LOC131842817 n=1 Tax=Achroia grisella TaxID=688607 RepID=UPI0027D29EF4|nr:uncharacterized protein LOC131842817 [Achroia grisella]
MSNNSPEHSLCFRIMPEKIEIDYINPEYIEDAGINLTTLAKGVYAINLYGDIKHTWANNVTYDVTVFEFQNNKYKPSFMEFHYRFCDMVNDDPYVGKLIANAGVKCPLEAGKYYFSNITIPNDDIPYPLPFQRAKGVGTVVYNPTGAVIANGTLYLRFK